MKQTLGVGAPASWELNPGLNNGNMNNVRAPATVSAASITTTVTRTVATSLATSILISATTAVTTWRVFVYG